MSDYADLLPDDTFVVPAGSALTFHFAWPGDDGDAVDLTGWSVDVTDVTGALLPPVPPPPAPPLPPRIRATWVDAEIGLIEVDIDALPGVVSVEERANRFRVRVTPPTGAQDALTSFPNFVWYE